MGFCPVATLQRNVESESQRDISHVETSVTATDKSTLPNCRPWTEANIAAVMGYDTWSED